MSKRRYVSDEEYQKTISNVEYIKIAQNAAKSFKGRIEYDLLKSCIYIGIFNSLAYHIDGKNKKFETSIHEWVYRECCKEISKNNRSHKISKAIQNKKNKISDEDINLNLTLEDLKKNFSSKEIEILNDCFDGSMKVEEIANKYNVAKYYVRNLKKRIKEFADGR